MENGDTSERSTENLSVAIWGIFALALLFVVQVARTFLLPLAIAVLLTFLFRPVVRALHRAHMPYPVGSALLLAALLGGIALAASHLTGPAMEWLERSPQTVRRLSREAAELKAQIEQVNKAAEEAEQLAEGESSREIPEVRMEERDASEVVMAVTWQLALSVVVVVVLLYFLLASGDDFVSRMTDLLRLVHYTEQPERVAVSLEQQVSRYLFTISVINVVLGCSVTVVFWLLGMPDPALWGVLAGALNFIPYAGAITAAGVFTLVAATAFQDVSHILLVTGSFVALTAVEGFLIQPMVVGRQLVLNPLAILLSFMFWGWIWGVPGVMLAVPILVILKALHKETRAFAAIGILIER